MMTLNPYELHLWQASGATNPWVSEEKASTWPVRQIVPFSGFRGVGAGDSVQVWPIVRH